MKDANQKERKGLLRIGSNEKFLQLPLKHRFANLTIIFFSVTIKVRSHNVIGFSGKQTIEFTIPGKDQKHLHVTNSPIGKTSFCHVSPFRLHSNVMFSSPTTLSHTYVMQIYQVTPPRPFKLLQVFVLICI